MRHRPPHFAHIFSGGGYASAYYSYMWSEVLDADAFAAFEETGDIFDPATAKKLRDNVYAAGGSRDPAELYTAFRGRLPTPDALLKRRGLVDAQRDLISAVRHRTARPVRLTGVDDRATRRIDADTTDSWTFTLPDIAGRRLRAAFRRRRGRPRDAGRRRQRARSHGGDGGDDRRRLSAHEPHRRRRLLARARAVGPRARADGGGPRRRECAPRALPRPRRRSRRAGRSPRSPCRARSAAGRWRSKPRKRIGGRLPLDDAARAGDPAMRATAMS